MLGTVLGPVLAGCGDEGVRPAWAVRDSAGVEVVESVRPAWGDEEEWRVGAEPTTRVGAVEGDVEELLSEVVGAVRLADGTVAVADAAQEVRFFGPGGGHVRTVGGPGEGPGEFTGLAALARHPGGGVWAWDFSLRRVTRISGDGEIDDVVTLDPEPPVLSPVGALPDGTFVFKQLWGAGATAAATRTGLRRDPVAVVRLDASGALLDTLDLVPGREVHIEEEDGRGVMITPPFGRNAVGTVRGDRVVVGSQETFEVRELAPDGAVLRVLRLPSRDVGLDPADARRLLDERVEAAPPERRATLRRSLGAIPFPESRPAYGGLLADREGNLWVSEWAPFPRVPGRWTVFGPDGRWLGEVEMPPGFQPTDIGDDWLVGVQRDEMDVEYVLVFPLVKPGG
ncbi:MAG: hypothetical protein PVI57_13745 [Gemmatimonadota bacterium]